MSFEFSECVLAECQAVCHAQSTSTAYGSETQRFDNQLITRRRARRSTAGGTYDLPRCRKSRLGRNFGSRRLTAISRGPRKEVGRKWPAVAHLPVFRAQPPSVSRIIVFLPCFALYTPPSSILARASRLISGGWHIQHLSLSSSRLDSVRNG